MRIRVFEAFAGYGSQMMALRRVARHHAGGADFQLVGWSEIDNDAIAAHNAVFPEYAECNHGDINEGITDFESAREMLGLKALGFLNKFDDVTKLISDINPKHIEALIALNELFTIAEAWNKEDGFVPDFSDRCQDKWIPWFDYDKNTARFMFRNTFNAPTNAYNFSSRLCFKTFARAKQFGKQFAKLYNKVFL